MSRIEAVMERLRASEKDYLQYAEKNGREAGHFWASTEAEYYQLRRIDKYCDSTSDVDFGTLRRLIDPDPESPLEDFYAVINCEWMFEDSDEWAKSFARGASEVYEEVKFRIGE